MTEKEKKIMQEYGSMSFVGGKSTPVGKSMKDKQIDLIQSLSPKERSRMRTEEVRGAGIPIYEKKKEMAKKMKHKKKHHGR